MIHVAPLQTRLRRTVAFGRLALAAYLSVQVLSPLDAREPSHPYAVTGYWLFGRRSAEQWRDVLTKVYDVGGDTVIQFGPHLRRVSVEDLAGEEAFAGCKIDGRSLIDSLKADLNAAGARGKLRHVYTYVCGEEFGNALIVRQGLDRRFEIKGRVFWRLVMPAADPRDRSRDLCREDSYDVIFVAGHRADSVAILFDEAERLGIRVFAGMPAAPMHPEYPWDVWSSALPVFLEFAQRVLEDYSRRFAARESFAGVYQSVEIPVAERTLQSVLTCYREQHALVRKALPGKRVLVSPYWDARRNRPTGVTPESVKAGIKLIARCGVDIVAPQDSRGTGKVGLFWPHQLDEQVDPRLQAVAGVGKSTYGEAYHANSREFLRMARRGLDELAEEEGLRVELWVNLEAFEPGSGVPCGVFTTSQRTTKERLDKAVMFAGPYPSKLISFMWDGYYTCKAGRDRTLGEEITADSRRPIMVGAAPARRNGDDGLRICGYNLAGARIELTMSDDSVTRYPAADGWPNSGRGKNDPRRPRLLEEIFVTFPTTHAQRAAVVQVNAEGPGGCAHHPFVLLEAEK